MTSTALQANLIQVNRKSPSMSANGAASDDLPNSEVDTMVSSREIDWLDVTQRIQAGDTESFKVYYENHFDLMFREAKRLSFADDNRCLDIVHDAMLKAIKSMKSTHLESRLAVWSKTVVKCVVYDRLRKQTADRKRELEYHQQKESASAHAWDAQLENQARLLWIEQQIMELDGELVNMFDLRYRLGWSLKQIASKFGMKVGAVDGRLRRAIEGIRKKAAEFEST